MQFFDNLQKLSNPQKRNCVNESLFPQESKGSIGVRMALGETQIVSETRQFLVSNGVALDSFSQVRLQ